MESIKRYFPIPFIALLSISSFYSAYQIWITDFQMAWLGAFIAVTPIASFFGYLMVANAARTSRRLPLALAGAIIGSLMTVIDFVPAAAAMAWILGLLGSCTYVFWYTPLDRSKSRISVGQRMPEAQFTTTDGQRFNTAEAVGQPHVWMFIRGNWCPLCVAQVSELAEQYRELEKMGVKVMLISAQSEKESQKLSQRFDAPMTFLADTDNSGAKALGLEHTGGVPFGLPGFEADTILPTVVITDKEGNVIFADQTDDYRIRPEPDVFLSALRQHSLA